MHLVAERKEKTMWKKLLIARTESGAQVTLTRSSNFRHEPQDETDQQGRRPDRRQKAHQNDANQNQELHFHLADMRFDD